MRYDYANMPELLSAELTDEMVEILKHNTNIKKINVSNKGRGTAQTMDWGYVTTKVYPRYKGIYTGNNVKVALLDTGIANHEDLPTPYRWRDFIAGNVSNYDDHGHGSFIAGIIAGKDNTVGYIGVAPDVDLYVGKVLDFTNFGYIDDFVAGIDWAISQDVDIINFSIVAYDDDPLLLNATRSAYDAGIIIVAPSGNGYLEPDVGWDMNAREYVYYPARDYSCIAVGAVNSNEERAYFSNYGTGLDIVAPGQSVFSISTTSLYAGRSGTSYAVGYVTGHLACLKEKYPSYTRSQLVNKLYSNAKIIGDALEYGNGLVMAEGDISPFSWGTPNPIYSGAPVTNLTSTMWNNFLIKINEVREYKGLVLFSFFGYYHGNWSFTNPIQDNGDRKIYYYQFNQARNGISQLNNFNLPSAKESGDKIYASDINALVNCLNDAI